MAEQNGKIYECPVSSWIETQSKVEEMHSVLTDELPRLVEFSRRAAMSNERIEDKLIAPATAVGKVDLVIVMPVIKTLCFMLAAIVIWFTGVQPHLTDIIGFFHK